MKNPILSMTLCASLGLSAQAALSLANYQALVKTQAPDLYFTFDGGSRANTVGNLSPTLSASGAAASQAGYDLFQTPADCIFFSVQNDALYDSGNHIIAGGGQGTNTSTASGTISLLFRTVDPGPPSGSTTSPGAKYVFSAGGSTDSTNANALFLRFENPNSTNLPPNSLSLGFGDSLTTILPAANVVPDTWYYFALSYNERALNPDGSPNINKASWYLGRLGGAGALLSGTTANTTNAVAGPGGSFFLGCNTDGKSTLDKPGDGRVDELAIWTNRALSAAQIQAQFASLPNLALPPVAAYQTVISNQAPARYFQLAGNTIDSINPNTALALSCTPPNLTSNTPSAGYCYDYFGNPLGACYFAFGTDGVYTNVNLLNGGGAYTGAAGSGKGSISGMFHGFPCTNFYTGQKYIFDAGGDTATSNAFALFLEAPVNANPCSLKLRFGDSSGVLVPGTNMLSEWYYFAVTFDETTPNPQAHWWAGRPGGALYSGSFSATNGSLAGAAGAFCLGNQINLSSSGFRYQNSSHTGNGQVSQVALWNRLLTTNEVFAQFNALTVRPPLSIASAGAKLVLSWPLTSDPGFVLESSPSLSPPTWSAAGPAVTSANQYLVTNNLVSGPVFYRLNKP